MMPRQDKRPVNLNLWHFRFPLNALTSISHRISGVFLIICLLIWLGWFHLVLLYPQDFADYQAWLSSWPGQLFVSVFWLALAFHWLAGVRHLLIEFLPLPSLKPALRQNAWLVGVLWFGLAGLIIARVWL